MLKDWNREEIKEVFHFKNSLRPFICCRDIYHDEWLFIDLDTYEALTLDALDYEGLYFYEKEDDEDFKGVEIDGKLEWID